MSNASDTGITPGTGSSAPYSRKPFGSGLTAWLKRRMGERYAWHSGIWRAASKGAVTLSVAAIWLATPGMPTGLGGTADFFLFGILTWTGTWIAAHAVAFLLSLIYLPVPRLFAGYALYAAVEVYLLGYYADLTVLSAAIIAGSLVILASGIGIAAALLRKLSLSASFWPAAAATAGILCVLAGIWQLPPVQSAAQAGESADTDVLQAVNGNDPSAPGPYSYETFTYGSGTDIRRDEFGSGVNLKSAPVDASGLISNWSWLKELFWGFDEQALPVNGRVWLPEGSGPRPLVLIVHGNHLMEDFSDDGYGYLGELLASRGFAVVSVDENFLNYSVWSGIPDNDMKARAWMLLQHLVQLKSFSSEPGNPFYNQIDWSSVALIGHSRGGQAVAMAADAERFFADDKELMDELQDIRIRSVIALAPTDRTVDGKKARLENINYLTIQGARDADVSDFYGDRQYIRTTFTEPGAGFKASLYMTSANHSRFNTSWGSMDEKMPGGLLLQLKDVMAGEEQRQAAKAYVSAFLEATLHNRTEYVPFMQDYRYGSEWLPDTSGYFNQYEDGSFIPLATYEEDDDKDTLTDGGTATGEGLTAWGEDEAQDRSRNDKGTDGVTLEWSGKASYTLDLSGEHASGDGGTGTTPSVLTFAVADLSRDLRSDSSAGQSGSAAPQLTIRLEADNGRVTDIPLAAVMNWQAQPFVTFTRLPWLLENTMDNGKYDEANEPVFQTVRIPLGEWKPEEVKRISFLLEGGSGKLMLDNIGFAAE